ncbi:adenylate kinase-domain-containing protein, partial [Chytridium lagenaria]
GSGKGTISKSLVKRFPVLGYLSSGDIFRNHVNNGTELGKKVKMTLANGGFVDDDLTSELITYEIGNEKGKHVLVDGYPRTVHQAEYLDYFSHKNNGRVDMAMFLDVPEKVILGRIEDRWIHAPSGRTYNYSFNPPKRHGLDDETGEALSKRPDDDIDVFRRRLEVFREMTSPLLDYYSRDHKLTVFKGSSSGELFPQLERVLQHRLD